MWTRQGRRTKVILSISLLLMGTSILSACIDVATTGAQAIYHHRSLQKNASDQYITMQIYKTIKLESGQFDDAHINVATYHGTVLLAGQVPAKGLRMQMEEIAKSTSGVERVYNMLQISASSSTLKQISDAWITAKVKTKLIASNDLDGADVKVVTENGTVYLMGVLQQEDADAAVSLASSTSGVESVVKIFTYLRVERK